MNAKGFFYGAAGLCLLTVAYTVGAGRAQGQVSSNRVVGITNLTLDVDGRSDLGVMVVTENGDWYYKDTLGDSAWRTTPWVRGGNIGVGPVGAEPVPWSGVKGAYRK